MLCQLIPADSLKLRTRILKCHVQWESVQATEIDKKLDIFSNRISFTAGNVSDEDSEAKKTKIFNYSAALSNMTTGMIRYGIKLET